VIDKLPPREREVFDTLFRCGESTAAGLCQAMENPPSNSAIRIMLSRLESKGFVRHRSEGQLYIYSPAIPARSIQKGAVRRFVETFFGGSPVGAAAALLGMADKIDPKELQQLEQAIAKAKREQRR